MCWNLQLFGGFSGGDLPAKFLNIPSAWTLDEPPGPGRFLGSGCAVPSSIFGSLSLSRGASSAFRPSGSLGLESLAPCNVSRTQATSKPAHRNCGRATCAPGATKARSCLMSASIPLSCSISSSSDMSSGSLIHAVQAAVQSYK